MKRDVMLKLDLECVVEEKPESCRIILEYLRNLLMRKNFPWLDAWTVQGIFFPNVVTALEHWDMEQIEAFRAGSVVFVGATLTKSGEPSQRGMAYFREDFMPFIEYAAPRLGYVVVSDGGYLDKLELVEEDQ